MTLHRSIVLLLLIFIVISCGHNSSANDASFGSAPIKSESAPVSETSEDALTMGRKIIQEGEITFETSNAAETRKQLTKIIEKLNGYMSNDHVYSYNERVEHRVTIRVPSDKFDELLANISELGIKIDNKYVNAQDVTEEYIDVEARLETKKALEIKYTELLKKAVRVEEILAIEKELAAVRGEIESMEGRIQYLKDRVAFSTLSVVFYEINRGPFGFTSKLGQALHKGWSNLLWFSIGLVNLWPFVLIFISLFIFYKRIKKRRALKK